MVDGELDLEACVAGIGRFGEALDDFGQGIERLLVMRWSRTMSEICS